MKYSSSRRSILKGLSLGAGASLFTPVLDQLAAHAAGAKSAVRKRVVFVVQGNGMNPAHLVPSGVTRPKDGRPKNDTLEEVGLKDRDLHTALEPLALFKERMTLIQGLSGRISEGGSGGHSTNHGALGCYPGGKGAISATIDLALAEALPAVVPHVGLGLMNKPEITMNYQISAAGPGKVVPIVCSPELALKSLFGSVAEGAGRAAFERKTILLDFMAEDVKRSRSALAGEEREKFDQYVDAFESLRDRQGGIDALQRQLKANTPDISAQMKNPTEVNRFEAQFELGTAALIAGLTNVVTLVSGGGGQHYISYPDLGIPVDGHHYGHGGGVPGKTAEECFVAVRQYHAKLIANLARRLESVKEGDGTMLDNTLIVYLSDSGEGHHGSLWEWPVVLIGNLGGKLNTAGRYLQFPAYATKAHRTMSNLYCTLLHAAGKPRDKFGVSDPGLRDIDQTGIISELLT